MTPQQDDQGPVPLQKKKRTRVSLTVAQRQILSALAAGFAVCLYSGPYRRRLNHVLLGNGSRLAYRSIESLLDRRLVAEAGREQHPAPDHRFEQVIFFKLTEQGRNEVVRQGLHFAAEEIELPLPGSVEEILSLAESYQTQYERAAYVEIRGSVMHEGRTMHLSEWQHVIAYDEAHNLLGVQGTSDKNTLLWVAVSLLGSLGGYGKLRMRPEPD